MQHDGTEDAIADQLVELLQDTQLLNEIQNIKEKSVENLTAIQPRKFGCGKGIFTHVADDFDATPSGLEGEIPDFLEKSGI